MFHEDVDNSSIELLIEQLLNTLPLGDLHLVKYNFSIRGACGKKRRKYIFKNWIFESNGMLSHKKRLKLIKQINYSINQLKV